ncbi:MAG: arsenic resistance protein [Spirochaetaceae bacterium]|jgi:ACR3 family arsenite efflux pump ArsB|nr:arsenic resistance protein [Spirochaetaceae bacterium]
MSVFAKLQPVFIILAAFLGILLGRSSAAIAQKAGGFIELFLMAMLFFVFLGARIVRESGGRSRAGLVFAGAAFAVNFVWTPVFAFLLAKMFLSDDASLQIGFIMLLVTPCTDWYLIFTGLANGNVRLGASVLPPNLILQIVLLPVYLFLFMGRTVAIGFAAVMQSAVIVLAIPLLSAVAVRRLMEKINRQQLFDRLMTRNDDIQFLLLCLAIVSMFASQGPVLLVNVVVFTKLVLPLLLFFTVNFFVSFGLGIRLKLPFADTIPLIFTTLARNSPVSLAIAVFAFPLEPVISLVLVMGPLIELPVLAAVAAILKRRNGDCAKGGAD